MPARGTQFTSPLRLKDKTNGFTAQTEATALVQRATVSLTSAQILALRATPKTLVAAPGSGKYLELVSALLKLTATATAYTETADNMAIRYTDGAGLQVSQTIEATGFIDATGVTIVTNALPKIDQIGLVANAALVLHNTGDGEYATGTGTIVVDILYRVRSFA